jgi:hypothetical protein
MDEILFLFFDIRKAHLFSIPFLTAPTNAIGIDDACAGTTTSWIAAHINFNLINRLGLTI